MLTCTEGLYRVEAPKSTVPSINSIYDRRAAAYREKLQALTSIPPSMPSSVRQSSTAPSRSYTHSHHHQPHLRPRAFSSTSLPFSPDASSSLRHVSSPLPSGTPASSLRPKQSTSGAQKSSKYTLHPQTPPGTATSLRTTTTARTTTTGMGSTKTQPTRRKTHPPPPIADVVNARFAGMPAPPPAPPISASPYVSIFSSRYSGAPHDGGDSDESDSGGGAGGASTTSVGGSRYTVIENDWRGGHVINYDGEFKRNKWGQIKGAIGHLGRKTS